MPRKLAIDRSRYVKRSSSMRTSMRSPVASALLFAAAWVLPPFALAQMASAQESMPYLAGTCTSCHGTDGRTAGAMPSLAGLSRSYIVQQMKDFREGRRAATIMHQIARGYTDRQAELVAEYFARQAPER